MRVRGTQEVVKPIEVNVDTVYVRTNIIRIEEENEGYVFLGWEYDEMQYEKNNYISQLTFSEDTEGIAFLLSLMMLEIDMLRMEIEILKGGA